MPVHRVGFEVAALGPFVPAVDVEDARAAGLGQEAALGHRQRFLESSGVLPPMVP